MTRRVWRANSRSASASRNRLSFEGMSSSPEVPGSFNGFGGRALPRIRALSPSPRGPRVGKDQHPKPQYGPAVESEGCLGSGQQASGKAPFKKASSEPSGQAEPKPKAMSAKGQLLTSWRLRPESASPLKADIGSRRRHVR